MLAHDALGTTALGQGESSLEVTNVSGGGVFSLTGGTASLARSRLFSGAYGAITLTGKAATLAVTGAALACAKGGFTLTRNPATLSVVRVSYSLVCAKGSVAWTGRAATLTWSGAYELVCAKGGFALTGGVMLPSRRMVCSSGGFTLRGAFIGLGNPNSLLDCAGASYTLTGKSISAGNGYSLTLDTGVFAQTRFPAVFAILDPAIDAARGSIALTGSPATLSRGVPASANYGTYAWTGVAATLTPARKLACATGATALAGFDVKSYGKYVLAADTRAFSAAMQPFVTSVTMPCAAGSYAMTGRAVTLMYGFWFDVPAGGFGLTAQPVSMQFARFVTAARRNFTVTGTAATLRATRTLTASAGVFAVAGQPASRTLVAPLDKGTFTVSAPTPVFSREMPAAKRIFTVTGRAATLRVKPRRIYPETGKFSLWPHGATLQVTGGVSRGLMQVTGVAAQLKRGRMLVAQSGAYSVLGKAATVKGSHKLPCAASAFFLHAFGAKLATARVGIPGKADVSWAASASVQMQWEWPPPDPIATAEWACSAYSTFSWAAPECDMEWSPTGLPDIVCAAGTAEFAWS